MKFWMTLDGGNALHAGARLLPDAIIGSGRTRQILAAANRISKRKRPLPALTQWATRIGLSAVVNMSRVAPPKICSLRRV